MVLYVVSSFPQFTQRELTNKQRTSTGWLPYSTQKHAHVIRGGQEAKDLKRILAILEILGESEGS